MKNSLKEKQKGITLISLVVTIIVILILAGISVGVVTNQNGVVERAQGAKKLTEDKNIEEQVNVSVVKVMSKNGTLTVQKLKKELGSYGGTVDGDTLPVIVTVNNRKFVVDEDGNVIAIANKTIADKEQPYVGYYADIDADGEVDGVIYADLSQGNTGTGEWNDSNGKYEIPKITEGLRFYYISQTEYKGKFGTKDVLSPIGTGKERFYVMALKDVGGKQNGVYYHWYNAAYRHKMPDYASVTSEKFGTGKSNTETMIAKWKEESYGEQNSGSTYDDIWGQIQTEVDKGWFIPSKEEWAAFAGELKLSKDISEERYFWGFGLSYFYWSSSQGDDSRVWDAFLLHGNIRKDNANVGFFARLGTTF